MPAWPGGNCPSCGEYMPENLIHCQACRDLLNPDLEPDSIEIPAFVPLQEISAMIEVEPTGYYIGCPDCDRELRISHKYVGEEVQCKHCQGRFPFDLSNPSITFVAFFASCPHCEEQLRVNPKYLGEKVACKHCGGQIHIVGSST